MQVVPLTLLTSFQKQEISRSSDWARYLRRRKGTLTHLELNHTVFLSERPDPEEAEPQKGGIQEAQALISCE